MLKLALALAFVTAPAVAEPIGPERAAELDHLLRHDCGSCHGMTLEGGLGPALTPDALAGAERHFLEAIVLDGIPGSAMPPWRPLLTTAEVRWLVDRLLAGEN
jgi:cytochrome c55X